MRVTSQARDPSRTPPQRGRAQGPDRRAPTAPRQGELAGSSAVAPTYFAPLVPLAAPLYPKLMVGDAHDPAERAADAFADRVMGGGGAGPAAPMGTTGSGVLRRKCSACEEEDKTLHRKEAAGAGGGGGRWSAPPVVHQALASAGHGLDAGARAQIEARGGVDLSGVRVHTDALAAESAAAVGARAYTVGRDVVFGAGQYRPGTSDGLRLIAHEVGHLGSGVVRRERPAPPAFTLEDSLSGTADLRAPIPATPLSAAHSHVQPLVSLVSPAHDTSRMGSARPVPEQAAGTLRRSPLDTLAEPLKNPGKTLRSGAGKVFRWGRDRVQKAIDNWAGGNTPSGKNGSTEKPDESPDGSGVHGVERCGLEGHLWWDTVRAAAEHKSGTWPNASRHLLHYLANTGSPLQVDASVFSTPEVGSAESHAKAVGEALIRILHATGLGNSLSFGHEEKDKSGDTRVTPYFTTGDWFYAIGGFTRWSNNRIERQDDGTLVMTHTPRIYDRYNWDKGKVVHAMGLTIPDTALGRLHRCGRAKEFDVLGVGPTTEIRWTPAP